MILAVEGHLSGHMRYAQCHNEKRRRPRDQSQGRLSQSERIHSLAGVDAQRC